MLIQLHKLHFKFEKKEKKNYLNNTAISIPKKKFLKKNIYIYNISIYQKLRS